MLRITNKTKKTQKINNPNKIYDLKIPYAIRSNHRCKLMA